MASFKVTVHETRALVYEIQAKSADEARDLALQGEFDGPLSTESLAAEIVSVEAV